jgi:hypothetical protein
MRQPQRHITHIMPVADFCFAAVQRMSAPRDSSFQIKIHLRRAAETI